MATPVSIEELRSKVQDASDLEFRINAIPNKKNLSKNEGEEEAANLRMKLCEILSDVMLLDPYFALRKDCPGRLWRACFYSRISEFRSRILKRKKKNQDVEQLEATLFHFLDEAIVLYKWMVNKYTEKLGPPQPDSSQLSMESVNWTPKVNTKGVVPVLYKLLLHQGDLNRYRENFKEAERCYSDTYKLAPGYGNPYNQLGVIAQSKDSSGGANLSCVVLYWYARALLATIEPFSLTKNNIPRLFETNREWLKKNKNPVVVPPPASSKSKKKATREQLRLQKSSHSQHFLARFVDIQYDFYGSPRKFNQNAIVDKLRYLLDDFASLVETNSFGDALVCKMAVIIAFSIHICKGAEKQLATAMLLSFGATLSQRIDSILKKIAVSGKKTTPSVRLVVPLVIVCEYVMSLPDETNPASYYRESLEAFWASLGSIAKCLDTFRNDLEVDDQVVELKEYDHLRGYKPFKSFVKYNMEEDGFVSVEEAMSVLGLSDSQVSTESASSTDEDNRIKLLCFLRVLEKLNKANDENNLSHGRFSYTDEIEDFDSPDDVDNDEIMDFSSDAAVVTKSDSVMPPPSRATSVQTDFASEDAVVAGAPVKPQADFAPRVLAKPPVAPPSPEESNPSDILVYKQAEGGSGPALLTPGALLQQNNTQQDTENKARSPERVHGVDLSLALNGGVAKAPPPAAAAPPATATEDFLIPGNWNQPDAMDVETKNLDASANNSAPAPPPGSIDIPAVPKLAPPPGFGSATPSSSLAPGFGSAAALNSVGPGFGGTTTTSTLEATTTGGSLSPPPPPGFNAPTSTTTQLPPGSRPAEDNPYDWPTANPWVGMYAQPVFGVQTSNPPRFEPPALDDVNAQEPISLLESSLISNLWEEEKKANPPLSRNPFLT